MITRLMEFLNFLGYPRIILKSDQEPSLVALKGALQEAWRGGEGSIEESPVNNPESNGAVERAVRSVKELIRTHHPQDMRQNTEASSENSCDVKLVEMTDIELSYSIKSKESKD